MSACLVLLYICIGTHADIGSKNNCPFCGSRQCQGFVEFRACYRTWVGVRLKRDSWSFIVFLEAFHVYEVRLRTCANGDSETNAYKCRWRLIIFGESLFCAHLRIPSNDYHRLYAEFGQLLLIDKYFVDSSSFPHTVKGRSSVIGFGNFWPTCEENSSSRFERDFLRKYRPQLPNFSVFSTKIELIASAS